MEPLVLIVEDDEDSRALQETLLAGQGFGILSAVNGLKAWDILQKQTPDLIVSDILMPEMDGFTLCRKCKGDKRLKGIPFVFYTATYTDDAEARHAYDIGADKFLIKPMEVDAFLTEIRSVLEDKQRARQHDSAEPGKQRGELNNEYMHIISSKLDKKVHEVEQVRKRVELSEAQYRQLVEFAPLGIMRTSPNGMLQNVNKYLAEMLGYISPDDMVRKVERIDRDLFRNPADWRRLQEAIAKDDEAYVLECVFACVGGREIWVEIRSRAILEEDGSIEAREIFVSNVTERKQTEEFMIQYEKMMAISGLAAGVAHEINNPMTAIIGFAQNIESRISKDLPRNFAVAEECGVSFDAVRNYLDGRGIPEMLQGIRESGRRIASTVSNMLDFSRKGEQGHELCELPPLLEGMLDLATNVYSAGKDYDLQRIEIVREFDTPIPHIVCHGDEIQQVFFNLLKNSAEAISEKEFINEQPRIILRLRHVGDHVELEVEDNGPGLPDALRERVLEPFFTTKPLGKGTGLGLSVSHHIIAEKHGGSMDVVSVPGEWTRFIVRLPTKARLGRRGDLPDTEQSPSCI